MSESDAAALVRRYLPFVKPKGRIVFITPQEKGYASDETHVRFVGSEDIARLCSMIGIRLEMQRSFPLPRAAGRFFKYNEFVAVARLSN